jgi:hypothetical protein
MMKSPTLYYCLLLFLLQLALQVSSFFPDRHISMAHGGILMVLSGFGLLAGVVPMLIQRQNQTRSGVIEGSSSGQAAKWRELPWVRWTIQLVSIYLVILVVTAVVGLRHGSSEMRADGYWAGSPKRSIPYRRITEAEYWRLEGHQARLLSAMGMMTCGVPWLAFALRRYSRSQG